MTTGFRPIKGVAITDDQIGLLNYPVIVFPKYNGWRGVTFREAGLRTKSMKPYANDYIRRELDNKLKGTPFKMIDGELLTGTTLQDCKSRFSTHNTAPYDFTYWLFDCFTDTASASNMAIFIDRLGQLHRFYGLYLRSDPRIKLAPYEVVRNEHELREFEVKMLAEGFEGIVLRDVRGLYKYGESTFNEGYLLKLKRFQDDEAIIVGWEPLYTNANEAEINELGLTKRSTNAENLIARSLLGAWIVRNELGTFNIGGGKGVTLEKRKEWWENREKYRHKIVKYKYLPHGMKDVPSGAQFDSFRSPDDMEQDDPLFLVELS